MQEKTETPCTRMNHPTHQASYNIGMIAHPHNP